MLRQSIEIVEVPCDLIIIYDMLIDLQLNKKIDIQQNECTEQTKSHDYA